MLPSAEIKELTVRDYLEIIQKHFWLIFTTVTVLTGLVAFYDFSSPKIYLAQTSLVVETEKPNITGKVEDVYGKELRGKEYFQTQLNILQSKSIADRVVNVLGLARDKEFMQQGDISATLLLMVRVEPSRTGNIIIVSVRGTNPLKITAIANTWAREYVYQDVERKVGTAKYGISYLEKQLADTLIKLRDAEREWNDFIRTNKIVNIPDIENKNEATIENLKSQRAQLDKEIADASKRYKEKHPKMISLKTQIEAVESKINEETNSRLSLQEKIAEYGVLKRKVETYKSIYDDFLKRAKELDVSKELTISNIRVLDQAEEPKEPVRPKPLQDIPLTLLLSFILAVMLALFLERLDTTLKTSDDVEFYSKFPFLGYIPSFTKEAKDKNEALISSTDPHSRVTESFRNLKVSLLFSFPQDKPLRAIVVTSSIPAEGKSFVASNLAIVFAQAKEPTLLIDADMRKGNLHKAFGLKPKDGLSSVLAGMTTLDQAISPTNIPNLWLLSAGPYAPNPTELLSSEQLPNILRQLGQKFKRIVIDSTPILNVSEAVILGDKCDGVLFVIRAQHTSLKYILEAKKIIGNKVKVIGAALNDTAMDRDRYYYYHYYYPTQKDNA
jgi:tyrosine-protein kinase Etk/Wzc